MTYKIAGVSKSPLGGSAHREASALAKARQLERLGLDVTITDAEGKAITMKELETHAEKRPADVIGAAVIGAAAACAAPSR
jgi:hypothetical protein